MTNWKYTDSKNNVVFRILDNGSQQSALLSSQEIQAYLAEGNTILAADAPTQSLEDAIALGQAYLDSKGYDSATQLQLIAVAAGGQLPTAKLALYNEVLTWILNLKAEATSNPATFAPTGEPPHLVSDILS
jgi:hypothetical protein